MHSFQTLLLEDEEHTKPSEEQEEDSGEEPTEVEVQEASEEGPQEAEEPRNMDRLLNNFLRSPTVVTVTTPTLAAETSSTHTTKYC